MARTVAVSVRLALSLTASLGRLIFFDQLGTAASDPVPLGALPSFEQWADSITAVLDDLRSREAGPRRRDGAFATAALFAATHPSRTSALVAHASYAEDPTDRDREETIFLPKTGRGGPVKVHPFVVGNKPLS